MNPTAPDALPLLARGAHRHPDQGVCLMEYVSVLAGEEFSDHPRCTHPLLARLARLVNDSVSDNARPRLVLLAPDLVGASGSGPRVAAEVMAAAAAAALQARPDASWLPRVAQRAACRREWALRHPRLAVVAGPWPADPDTLRRVVRTAASGSDRDARLHRLLAAAIAGCRGARQPESGPKPRRGSNAPTVVG